ncbi:MAG: hypothetical protein ABI824_16965, partial [Acidobacteriota bacterium]
MDVSLRTSGSATRLPLTLKATAKVVARDSSFQQLLTQAGLDRFANALTPSGNPSANQSGSPFATSETLVFDVDTIPEGRALGTFTSNLLRHPATTRSHAKTGKQKEDRQNLKDFHAVRVVGSDKCGSKKQTAPERKAAGGARREQSDDAANNNVAQAATPQDKLKPLSLLHLLAANPSQANGGDATSDPTAGSGQVSATTGAVGIAPDVMTPASELAFSLTLQVPEAPTDDASGSGPGAPVTSIPLAKADSDSTRNPLELSPKVSPASTDESQVQPALASDGKSSGQDHASDPPIDQTPAELPMVAAPNLNPVLFAAAAESPAMARPDAHHPEPAAAAPSQAATGSPASDKPTALRPLQRMDVVLQTADQVVRLDIRQIMGTVRLSVHASDPGLAQQLRHSLP